MKALTLLVTITLLALSSSLLAGQRKSVEGWLEQKHAQLSSVEEPSSIRKVVLDHSEEPNKDGYFRMYPKKGYLEFADGSWILLTSHSAHAEDGLPDISLIRTSTGEYYSNRGHCCLPILLFSKERIVSLEGFLKTTGKGAEAKPTPWIKYNREQGVAPQSATRTESKLKGDDKPQPESEERSR